MGLCCHSFCWPFIKVIFLGCLLESSTVLGSRETAASQVAKIFIPSELSLWLGKSDNNDFFSVVEQHFLYGLRISAEDTG